MKIDKYRRLINDFIDGKLSAEVFSIRYMEGFKAEKTVESPMLFEILQGLFEDADAFSPDCSEDEETILDISSVTLRRRASEALQRIDQLTGNR